ncbi:MAG: translation initiation factor IF-2 [Neomegalonema sp.]|nr:translation initiation factor IF-2 [Neomegalonema sp.]
MSERDTGDRRRSGGGQGSKTLSLRGGGGSESGRPRQGSSNSNRSKQVLVVRKNQKKVINKPKADGDAGGPGQKEMDPLKRAARKAGLSEDETQRRLRALEAAKIAEIERKKRAIEEAKRRAEEEAKRKAEEEARKRREAEEAARRIADEKRAEEEAAQRAAEEAAAKAAAEAAPKREAPAPETNSQPQAARPAARAGGAAPNAGPRPAGARPQNSGGEQRPSAAAPARPALRPAEPPKKPTTRNRTEDRRRSSKLTIGDALRGDAEGGRQRSEAAMRRRIQREKRKSGGAQSNDRPAKVYRDVVIPEAITVAELANRMTERGGDVVKALMKMGLMVRINDTIDQDTAELIVTEFGHRVSRVSEADVEDALSRDDDPDDKLEARAPVVTIMGHVDHGKTSLLDALRKTNVVSGEAGGITQHIGAYQVQTGSGGLVTFLDTPGHAAFTSMRARGAQVTDVVILVVAADDSVMPQTIEAISHAKAANVPMIVAINKCDKPAADPQKVRVELLQHDIQVEGMGGEVLDVEVSAVTGAGLDTLLENVLLQAELLDLKAAADRPAEGAVVEAKLDTGRGPVATVLVQRGTLKVGDIFVVGEEWGKVRALINDQGERIDAAGPSAPVEVLGLTGAPEAGDVLNVVEDEAKAREISEYRQRKSKEMQAAKGSRATLDQLLAQAKKDEDVAELPVVIKADVQGSVEAIVQALEKIGNDEVRVRVLHNGVGAITESDVTLADASGAPIIGFNVRANAPAREASNQKGVEIRYYSVIYDLVDDVKAAASGLLSPEVRETFIGYAKIKQVFKITGIGNVAGCEVTEGVARREAGVRLLRDNVVIHTGKLKTLKRFKDEVKEVPSGQECGMAFEKYEDIRADDVIEIFETEEITRTL